MNSSRLTLLIALTFVNLCACNRSATTKNAGATLDAALDPEQRLIKAAQRGDLALVEELLQRGVNVNARPALGISPLWQACWSGHTDVALSLLRHGADPNVHDQGFQRSPLMMARDLSLINLLVEKGAEDAPYQLCQAALDGSSEVLAAILAGRPFEVDALRLAKANARLMRRDETAKLLDRAAGVALPELPQVAFERLQPLAGDYRDAKLNLVRVRARLGTLVLETGGNAPQALLAIDESTFVRGAKTYRFRSNRGSFQMETSIAARLAEVHTRDESQEDNTSQQRVAHDVSADDEIAALDTWPQFRGRGARGIARDQDLPQEFSTQGNKHISWISQVPGLGNSSPIVWKQRLFVTTAVRESGEDQLVVGNSVDARSTRDDVPYTWALYCFDSKTGREMWRRVASSGVPEVGRHPKSSYANPTPATDGRYVVALFNSGDLQCFTTSGEVVWKRQLGVLRTGAVPEPAFEWGFASSPAIHDNLVVIQCDLIDDAKILAFALDTGKEVWKRKRAEPPSWATPIVIQTGSSPEVVTSGSSFIRAYDLPSGVEKWRLPGMSATTVPTPLYWDNHLYVASGHLPTQPILAIRLQPATSQTGPELAWSHDRGGPYVTTPLIYGGNLYVCSSNGVLTCYDARTGRRAYRERISQRGAGSFSASPVAADERIYFASESGAVVEVQAGQTFMINGVHSVGDDCMATPAICGGRMYLRTRHGIVAVGKQE